jgi:hypothetical protein
VGLRPRGGDLSGLSDAAKTGPHPATKGVSETTFGVCQVTLCEGGSGHIMQPPAAESPQVAMITLRRLGWLRGRWLHEASGGTQEGGGFLVQALFPC